MRIEACTPPEVIEQALRIAAETRLDIGGIEYLVNQRDGQIYFYDVNALSNFLLPTRPTSSGSTPSRSSWIS